MLHVLKFISSFVFPPGLWITILLVWSCFVYRRNRWKAAGLGMMALLLYISSISLVSDALLRSLEKQYVPPVNVQGDVIVVLTGGTTLDTPDFGGLGHPTGETAGRLITAVELYRKLQLPIIVSGGQVSENSAVEAEICRRALVAMGIPDQVIELDTESRSTAENAQNVKRIVQGKDYRNPILVTSAHHMPRAMKNFEKVGVSAVAYPTMYMVNRTFQFDLENVSPSYDAVYKMGNALKEYIGLLILPYVSI